MNDLPSYRDLPQARLGGRSAWGLFGNGDNLGLVNLMTSERVVNGASLVKRGAVFPLDVPFYRIAPALAKYRGVPRHSVLHEPGTIGFDDLYDNFYPQGSSQWDSLAHVGYAPNQFYNGATEQEVISGARNTIDHWSRHGMAGRAVVLDVERAAHESGQYYHPGESTPLEVEDLERAREQANVQFEPGDAVLLHTGFLAWYVDQALVVKEQLHGNVMAPGIAHSERMCEYLWDSHVAAICSDTFAVEVWPPDRGPDVDATGFMHRVLIGQFGMALGELWWLKDLADDCAGDGVYESFLVSAPFNAPGGIGSPANAIAIK